MDAFWQVDSTQQVNSLRTYERSVIMLRAADFVEPDPKPVDCKQTASKKNPAQTSIRCGAQVQEQKYAYHKSLYEQLRLVPAASANRK
jgi:hypothetical protein